MQENNQIQDLISSESDLRKWIILEDNPTKTDYLLSYIAYYFPNDEIHLLFANESTIAQPLIDELDEETLLKPFSYELFVDGKNRTIKGKVNYYVCNHQNVHGYFQNIISTGNNIFLLDVHLQSLNGADEYLSQLFGGSFLNASEDKGVLTIMSQIVNYNTIKRKIKADDPRILTVGAGQWEFVYPTFPKDCKEVVLESDKHWKKLYSSNQFTTDVFLEKMAKLTRADCHNWQNPTVARVNAYLKKGIWHKEWNMPIQLSYLIKLLDFAPDEFIEKFDLKNEEGHFNDSCPICNCLKTMGTSDGYSINLLGVLLFAWAIYRRFFKDGDGNNHFEEAIKGITDDQDLRYQLITPPQQNRTLQETILSFETMMEALLYSSIRDTNKEEKDNLRSIKLDRSGLSFHLTIDPEKLQKKIAGVYNMKVLGSQIVATGNTSESIVDFFIKSRYCDKMMMDRVSFLGNCYGLDVFAAGTQPINGTIIKFGYGK